MKTRAQEAVRQWRAKCRRLQKELEEVKTQAQFHMEKALQVSWPRCIYYLLLTQQPTVASAIFDFILSVWIH